MSWLFRRKRQTIRKQLAIMIAALSAIVMLPVVAVIVASQSGLILVSSALAAINPITHRVEIKGPNGDVIAQLDASTVWPVRGYVSLEFGEDDSPYQKHHTAIDIAGATGDPITTFMDGVVIKAVNNENNDSGGYGKYVYVDHGNGITSRYAHMSEVLVHPLQVVKPGDVLGLRGSTGHSTGPHVHFEIRINGIPVDPRIFMVGDPLSQ